MVLFRVFVLVMVLAGQAAWAEDAGPAGSGAPSTAQAVDLARAFASLHQALTLAESYVAEHLDLDGRFHPGTENSASWGRMHFRFYPQGRSRPHDAIEADTWIKWQDREWSFQFRFNEVTPAVPDLDQHL
ncbi:hypothetical protein YTPLAS18_03830 [Nitrospira sp.]|nr:hypothetical protein YTPLAS18_03830 [Nitrospira sp.]